MEAPRDQADSAFTPILRRLFDRFPALLAAVFVDQEGETIDYVSEIEPYEAKVVAAHMHMLMGLMCDGRGVTCTGEPFMLEIAADQHEVWVRRLGDEYVLVALLSPQFEREPFWEALLLACQDFRTEVGLSVPTWEVGGEHLSVRVRAARGWRYAPAGYCADGRQVSIAAVLGRWIEAPATGRAELVCFRVRTEDGHELTLEHDCAAGRWRMRD